MEKYLDTNRAQFKAFMEFPVDTPLQMLNLLKFKDKLDNGLTGKEQYTKYMKAATPFIKASNAKILFYGEAKFTVIGPENELEWDKVIIVEYATKQDFVNMVMTEGYPAHLRVAALEDSRLIFCTPVK